MAVDVTKGVDQVEWQAMKFGSASCDDGTWDDRVAESAELHDFSDPHTEGNIDIVDDDLVNESFAGRIQEKIQERKKMMGDAYPFNLDGNKLSYENESGRHLLYEFLLLASIANDATGTTRRDISKCFERIAAMIVSEYFGSYAECHHVGFPRDDSSNFEDAMIKVNKLTGEFSWNPDKDAVNHQDVKDEGLDFIIRMKHADNRLAAQLFILGQCACGQNWDSKTGDLKLGTLEKWFHPMSYVPPVKAFAVPHYIEKQKIINSSRECGLLFDRVRIVNIAFAAECQNAIAEFFSENSWTEPILSLIEERRS